MSHTSILAANCLVRCACRLSYSQIITVDVLSAYHSSDYWNDRIQCSCTSPLSPADRSLSMPVLVAPMAMQKLCHPEGELAMSRGAHAAGTINIVSTMATCGVGEVAAATKGPLWFQIYVLTHREATTQTIKEAEEVGYEAFVITIDAPRLGKYSPLPYIYPYRICLGPHVYMNLRCFRTSTRCT